MLAPTWNEPNEGVVIVVVDADKAKLSTEVVLTENVVPLSNSPPPEKVTSLSEPIVLVVFPPPLPNFKVVLIPPEVLTLL